MTIIDKLTSIAFNSIVGGLQGFEATINIPIELLKDELVQTRLAVLQKYAQKNLLPLNDLYYSINCISVNCDSIAKCCEDLDFEDEKIPHFEIPQIFTGAGDDSILYLGSIDKSLKFKVYTSPLLFKYHKYKIRGKNKPYVYIDMTPNKNNNLDGYIFNAPLLETISITAIFKDPRALEDFVCCEYDLENVHNMSFIDMETVDTVVNKYIKYFRLLMPLPVPNDQSPK